MANRCINLSHPEFKKLLSQSDIDPISLAADISLWQDRNNTDLFPGLEQLVPPVEKVEYRFAAVDKILAKLPILNKWWKDKSMSKDIFWKKFKELGIPAEQVELYQESTAETFEEVVVDTLAKYSFDVEIKTTVKNYTPDINDPGSFYQVGNAVWNGESLDVPENTSYYANLTVPGGTNYQELEIKTPNITPIIKGHAEFATDQGIGWVRSDDAENTQDKDLPSYIEIGNVGGIIVSYSKENGVWKKYLDGKFYKNVSQEDVYTHYSANTPNKNTVRRVLELQSDLFQKGKTKEFLTEVDEYEKSTDFNKKENKFLQLLNKDGNWVKFFIQSIVADSKKKGYKNILFPAGETAAKVEGHTTLANEIEAVNSDIQNNKEVYQDLKGKWRFNTRGQSWETKEEAEIYHDVIITKLEKKKQELKSEGIEKLKPIEGFYEVRVQNTLKKLYPDNVVRITDEYGNDWFSVNLYDERTGQVLFQKEFINEDGSRKRYIDEMVAIDKARKFNLANPNSKATVIKVMGEKGDRRVYYAIDVKSNKSTGQVLRDTIFQGESTLKSSELLSRIANSKHPLAKLAGKLLEYVKYNDVDISIEDRDNTVTTKDGNSFSAAGAYYSDTNSITLFENAKYPESRLIGLILHEILHSLTYHQLRTSAKSSEEFAKLLEHARKFLPDQYALSNTDEFLVALFTDSKFISSLENVPAVEGKFKNFFQEVFDWFLKLLRLNKPEFYEQAFAVATNILEDFKVLNDLSLFPGEVLGEQETELETIANSFTKRFGIDSKVISKEEAQRILGKSSKDMFFQILDEVDVFDSKDPKGAKQFIDRVFRSVESKEDAQKAYKKLAKKYHPDISGSNEIMSHINSTYDDYKDGKLKAIPFDKEDIVSAYSQQNTKTYEESVKFRNEQEDEFNKQANAWKEFVNNARKEAESSSSRKSTSRDRSDGSTDPLEIRLKYKKLEDDLAAKRIQDKEVLKTKYSDLKGNSSDREELKRLQRELYDNIKSIDDKFYEDLKNVKSAYSEEIKNTYFQVSESNVPAGFYDTVTKTAYLVEGVADETTPIHEIFTHPFLELIEKENKELYKNLLKEAYKNKAIREYVDKRYEKSQREKEYIARAIDLEANNQLQDKSLIDYIKEFWQAVSKYVSNIFGGQSRKVINIKPTTTIKELVDFVLKDNSPLNLNKPDPSVQDNKLKALLERTGFSLVTLSEYEKITGKKVNANALVDMAARLVAMADGASVKALTEELAHIAVAQSRETTEYKNAMKLLEATEEFEEFYDQYMEEYNDDTHVREEILGKILMKDLEVKLGTSIGMWLRRLWNKFLNKFRNNELSDYVSKITDKFIANPERSVNDSKIYFQLSEGEKTLQQQVNKLNRRYKELNRRQKSNPSLINQIRALREELEGNKNGLGIYKFLKLLNTDTKNAIDFIKSYFTITEKDGQAFLGARTYKEAPSDNMTKQLAQYIGYYLPFLKELNAILDEDSVISIEKKKILDKMIRIHVENFEVINRAYNQFLNENNRISTEAKELDIAGKRIMSTNELREAPRDSNFLETWFGLARNNSDVLVRLAHRAISDIKNRIRRAVLNWSDDFLANSMDYIGKDMSWVAERVTVDVVDKKTGLVTKKVQKSGNFIDEVHQGQWDIAREKFHTDLHDKYGFSQDFAERIMQKKVIQGYNPKTKDAFQRDEIKKLKEYNQEIAHWYKFNSIPNPRAKEIIDERAAALGYEQFEFWKMRNMELNPDGSVKYFKGELIVPSRGKENSEEFKGTVTYFKTKDWTNKDYDKLSDKDKKFLQYLKDQKKEIDKNIPFAVANRLPQMYESTLDIMRLNEPEVFKRLGKNIKSSIVRQEDDTEFNDTPTLNDGTILDDVPIRFTSLISEPDRVTTDILSSLIAYKQMQENYVQMSAQLPMFENWLQGAKRRVVKSGDKVIRGEDSWSFDALKKFLQVHVSGKEKEDLTLTVLGTKVSVTKAVEKLSQWVRMKNLGFNFIAMTSNLISAKVFATLESIVGTYTTVKSSAFANKEFFSLLPTVMSSFNGVRSTDRISSLMTYFGLGRDIREMFDDLDKHVLMRNQPDRTLMYGFEKGDYFSKAIVMISILDNYRVHENKWYTAKEAEAAGLNFEEMTSAYNMLKTDKNGKVNHTIPDSVIDNITARMKTIATRVDGSLSPEDKGAIYQNAVFSMIGLHRGWLFEGLSRKLKTKGYDFTLNKITEGEYRTVMDLIGRFFMPGDKIQRIKNLLAKYNELEDYQKENLKRVMLELSMIAAFTIIALALNSGDDDDEEDYFRDLLAYQSNRVLLEVSSFYNPTELISAIKDPIVPARDLELVTNFTDMFNTEIIEKGKWEGMTKQQKYLLQLVPGIKGYTTLSDPESQNNFLKNKNLKPTYSAYEFFVGEEENEK